jgi:hypothetical protein
MIKFEIKIQVYHTVITQNKYNVLNLLIYK